MNAASLGPTAELVRMLDDEDWMMRPVINGMCRYESLKDGTVSLDDLSRMNEALDVQAENRRRLHPRGT